MVQISEVKGNTRENRTAAHTHIKGLGLRLDGTAENSSNGFVGQTSAREVSKAPPRNTMRAKLIHVLYLGMRCSGGPDKSEEDGWEGGSVGRWSRNWKDRFGAGRVARARNEGAVLSDCGQRGVFDGGEENRSSNGELPESNRYG